MVSVAGGTNRHHCHRARRIGLAPLDERIRFSAPGGFASLKQPQVQLRPFGRQRLIDVAALTKVSTPGPNPVSRAYVNFTAGVHSSLLDPTASLPATIEMQTQAVTFAVTNGTVVAIGNPAVIQP